ncbi:hypothetical protein NQ318_014342 [Aromia moschata]|uniref:Uncharacterized protein n=1 Tax=Aromia moschata TaxID=1265417 RepID=A0AAV8YZD6_9CUCU|nr:hypothetical protein NQ318_014342 [Aromia moschata]
MAEIQTLSLLMTTWLIDIGHETFRAERYCHKTYFGKAASWQLTAAPFSEEPGPTKIRDECDYDIKITHEMARNGTSPRPVRVYADGAF